MTLVTFDKLVLEKWLIKTRISVKCTVSQRTCTKNTMNEIIHVP